jgi:hypothetical protein
VTEPETVLERRRFPLRVVGVVGPSSLPCSLRHCCQCDRESEQGDRLVTLAE